MVHIVSSINSLFRQHFCAMAMSVISNSSSNIQFHILHNDLNDEDIFFIRNVFKENKSVSFSFYLINDSLLKEIKIQAEHLTVQTFYRLLISEILPSSIEKVVYLDSDLIVETDIINLYEVNVDGFFIAAVNEIYTPSIQILNLSSSRDYFNAGVLVLNLKKWREENFYQSCLNYANNNSEKLLLADQDILNGILKGKWKRLHLHWNVVKGVWDNYEDYCNIYKESEIKSILKKPSIVHYTSPSKPWHLLCDHSYKERYFDYLNMSNIKYIKYPELQYLSLKENIYIFGTGNAGINILNLLSSNNIEINGFYDNDSKKWGTKVLGLEIYNPENCYNNLNDFIIIASMYYKEISEQLVGLGLVEYKDFCRYELLHKLLPYTINN